MTKSKIVINNDSSNADHIVAVSENIRLIAKRYQKSNFLYSHTDNIQQKFILLASLYTDIELKKERFRIKKSETLSDILLQGSSIIQKQHLKNFEVHKTKIQNFLSGLIDVLKLIIANASNPFFKNDLEAIKNGFILIQSSNIENMTETRTYLCPPVFNTQPPRSHSAPPDRKYASTFEQTTTQHLRSIDTQLAGIVEKLNQIHYSNQAKRASSSATLFAAEAGTARTQRNLERPLPSILVDQNFRQIR